MRSLHRRSVVGLVVTVARLAQGQTHQSDRPLRSVWRVDGETSFARFRQWLQDEVLNAIDHASDAVDRNQSRYGDRDDVATSVDELQSKQLSTPLPPTRGPQRSKMRARRKVARTKRSVDLGALPNPPVMAAAIDAIVT